MEVLGVVCNVDLRNYASWPLIGSSLAELRCINLEVSSLREDMLSVRAQIFQRW